MVRSAATPPLERASLADLCYVCVVSQFTLPNFEACLLRRPRVVSLIVSDGAVHHQAAERLKALLAEELGGEASIHILSGHSGTSPLQGDNLIENQHWVRTCLRPWLERTDLPGRKYLNFTGGTKAMSAVLLDAWCWDGFDYTAAGQLDIQELRRCRLGHGVEFSETGRRTVASAKPLQVARLYAQTAACYPLNRIVLDQPERTLALAQRIWTAQHDDDAALAEVLQAFDAVWGTDDHPVRQIEMTWPEFLGRPAPSDEQHAWLNAFSELTSPQVFAVRPGGVSIPGNKSKGVHRALRDWISGIWLEQLSYQWLTEAGLEEAWVARNIHAGEDEKKSATRREADLLIHHRNTTLLIETKAGLPHGHHPREMLQQLVSLGDRFGRTRKALLMAPALRGELAKTRRWEAFVDSCAAAEVKPIASREELTNFIAPVLIHRRTTT